MPELEKYNILIVDDEPQILKSLQLLLEREFASVYTITNPDKAVELISNHRIDILLMDMNFERSESSGERGLALLKQVKVQFSDLAVVVMTAFSDIDLAVNCIKLGASDFIHKPWSNQRLIVTLANVLKLSSTERRNSYLKANTGVSPEILINDDLGMVGQSGAIRLVREKIRKVADSDANVLILGENGTGKELVANAIHALSSRSKNPLIKIDLGSIHEQLFESELFGAKKGAYTGANVDKIGRMQMADQGSLFLDELGNLSLPLQKKLLSALQNREITPVGGTNSDKIDIRLISATNFELPYLLDDSNFRQDLLYRINTVEIQLPPLRERKMDIPILANHFLGLYMTRYKKSNLAIHESAMEQAQNYEWPGNIRELEHAIERAVVMSEGGIIQIADIVPMRNSKTNVKATKDLNLARLEKHAVREALKQHGGSITESAKELGITRAALYRRLEKYDL